MTTYTASANTSVSNRSITVLAVKLMRISIYNMTTREILRVGEYPPDRVALQVQDGEEFFLCPAEGATHIVNNEAVAAELPDVK